MLLDLARLFVFPALMAFAAVSDMLTMTIPNRVSLLLVAGFAVMAAASGMDLPTLLDHAGAGLLVLVLAFGCFAIGQIGGGDAKVAAAAGLWFGFAHLLDFLVYASLLGGGLTLLMLQFRQWPLPYVFVDQRWLLRLHCEDSGIPYGIALTLGALLVYPDTAWVRAVDLARFAWL